MRTTSEDEEGRKEGPRERDDGKKEEGKEERKKDSFVPESRVACSLALSLRLP